jgi:hypothetical protein
MSSAPESIPLTRRIQGGLAIAVGVLVAIVVALTLVVLPGETLRAGRTSAGPSNPTPTTSARPPQGNIDHMPQTSPQGNLDSMPLTRFPGPRQVGAAVNGGPAAALGNTASSPTVQANPDRQESTSQEAHAAFLDPAKAFDLMRSGDLRAFP